MQTDKHSIVSLPIEDMGRTGLRMGHSWAKTSMRCKNIDLSGVSLQFVCVPEDPSMRGSQEIRYPHPKWSVKVVSLEKDHPLKLDLNGA